MGARCWRLSVLSDRCTFWEDTRLVLPGVSCATGEVLQGLFDGWMFALGDLAVDVPYDVRGGGSALWPNLLRAAACERRHYLEISS